MAHPLRRPPRRAVRGQAPRGVRPGARQPRPATEGPADEGPTPARRTGRDLARGQGRRPCIRADPGRPQGRSLPARDRLTPPLALVAPADRVHGRGPGAPRGRRPARPGRQRRPARQDQQRVAPGSWPRWWRPAAPATPMRSVALTMLTAGGCEEPQLAGTPDRRGAIYDTELGVDAADVRADRVRRDGQLAGDLRPGQVRRKIPQYPELARAELFRRRRRGLVFGRQG